MTQNTRSWNVTICMMAKRSDVENVTRKVMSRERRRWWRNQSNPTIKNRHYLTGLLKFEKNSQTLWADTLKYATKVKTIRSVFNSLPKKHKENKLQHITNPCPLSDHVAHQLKATSAEVVLVLPFYSAMSDLCLLAWFDVMAFKPKHTTKCTGLW